MSILVIPCPECSYELRLPNESYLGRKGKCPQCGHKFILQNPIVVDIVDVAPAPQPAGAAAGSAGESEPAPPAASVQAAAEAPSAPPRDVAPPRDDARENSRESTAEIATTPEESETVETDTAVIDSQIPQAAPAAPAASDATAIEPPPKIPVAREVAEPQPASPAAPTPPPRMEAEAPAPAAEESAPPKQPTAQDAAPPPDSADVEFEEAPAATGNDTVDLADEIAAKLKEASEQEDQPAAPSTPQADEDSPIEPIAPRPASRARTEPPEQFGRYQILRKLGQGTMGAVYLAHDSQLDRHVALKIPAVSHLDDRSAKERFFREARAAALLRNPNICAVHDIGETDGLLYISMAYINGRPLTDYIARSKPQSERKVATTIRRVALALEDAHQQGIIHRDLKPDNIMIDDRREPIIMDFGLARQMNREESSRLTRSGAIIGSPAYMSPEQVEGDPDEVGPASDIFSLGVILYELLTQKRPFEGTIGAVFHQIVSVEPKRPSELRPDLHPWMEAICLKMMAKKPENRYSSMGEVADALAAFLRMGGEAGTAGMSVVLKPARDQGSSIRLPTSSTSASDFVLEEPPPRPASPARIKTSGDYDLDQQAAIWVLTIGGILSLTVDGRELKGLNSIDDLPSGAFRVKTIGLFNNQQVTDEDLARLSELRRLEAVTLTNTQISDAGLDHLKKIPHLKVLGLDRTRVTPAGLKALQAALPNCRITYGNGGAAEKPDDGRSPDRRAAEWVLAVGGTLKVSLPKGETRTIAALENLPAEDFRVIDVSLLRRNLVDDNGLRHFRGLDSLVVLRLSDTGVTDAGLEHLKGLHNLPVLDLSFTQITDKGLEALGAMRGLRQLDIANTRVSDAGLQYLTGLTELQFLGLYGTQVTDQGIKVLAGLKGLQFLGLGNTGVTESGAKALKSKLANCTISRQ